MKMNAKQEIYFVVLNIRKQLDYFPIIEDFWQINRNKEIVSHTIFLEDSNFESW